jgi:thiamine-phosphate pyrophosphorylase
LAGLPTPPFLCVITDDELSADRIVGAVESACTAGPIVVQLRAPKQAGAEFFDLALRLRTVTTSHGSLLIINDRLDVALAARADGVHLPASGIPPATVRDMVEGRAQFAKPFLIGLSVHSLEEIRAHRADVDYFQFGPVFATPSKAVYGPPQGIAALADAVAESSAARRPLVAVGGIDAARACAVADAGVAGVAVIRAVMRASDPGAAVQSLLAAISRTRA